MPSSANQGGTTNPAAKTTSCKVVVLHNEDDLPCSYWIHTTRIRHGKDVVLGCGRGGPINSVNAHFAQVVRQTDADAFRPRFRKALWCKRKDDQVQILQQLYNWITETIGGRFLNTQGQALSLSGAKPFLRKALVGRMIDPEEEIIVPIPFKAKLGAEDDDQEALLQLMRQDSDYERMISWLAGSG